MSLSQDESPRGYRTHTGAYPRILMADNNTRPKWPLDALKNKNRREIASLERALTQGTADFRLRACGAGALVTNWCAFVCGIVLNPPSRVRCAAKYRGRLRTCSCTNSAMGVRSRRLVPYRYVPRFATRCDRPD